MGNIIRWLAAALGAPVRTRIYFTEVTKTIDSLPARETTRWIWGGLLHIAPVLVVIGLLLWVRSNRIAQSKEELATLFLAASWVFVGPALIWFYERYTLPEFDLKSRHVVKTPVQQDRIRRCVYSSIYDFRFCRLFTPIWILVVLFGFYGSRAYIFDLGIEGYYDYFFWIVTVGVALVAYYTSIGFCFAYKAICLTNIVASSELERKVYHKDEDFGLSFVGDFAFRTALMFFSGWLFAPLIVTIGLHGPHHDYTIPAILLGIYFIYTILSFFIPIYTIHKKILSEKLAIANQYHNDLNTLVELLSSQWSDSEAKRYDFYKKVLDDIRALPNWPLKLDVTLKLASTTVLSPALAAIISGVLKNYKFL